MSKQPNIAVLGCGYWGKNLVRNFNNLGVLRRVIDPHASGRALAAELAPKATVGATIEEALGQDIDALVIATPAETHFALCRQALLAGKDVLVEKPLALCPKEGAQLVRLAREKERILAVGHVLEYHPAVARLHEVIASGALGKIQYLYSNRLNLGKIRREENILWSFAPHDLAVILRLVGAMPLEVIACGGSYVRPNIADVTVTNLLFDNGVRAHVYVSWLHPFKEQRLVVVGSKAMVVFDDVAKTLTFYEQRVEWHDGDAVPIRDSAGTALSFSADEPLQLECQAFVDAIVSRKPPLTHGESALQTLRILQAAQQSVITNGQAVLLSRIDG